MSKLKVTWVRADGPETVKDERYDLIEGLEKSDNVTPLSNPVLMVLTPGSPL